MKTIFILFHIILILVFSSFSGSIKDNITNKEASSGIQEALIVGTKVAVKSVSRKDGYYGNPAIKIPFPKELQPVEKKLRAVGMGSKLDKAVVSMNRAAEDAAMEAGPIFIDAIKGMDIKDATKIVTGNEYAGTNYLKKNTSDELTGKFQPKIEVSLNKVDATKYWDDVIGTYNKLPMVKKVDPDLSSYVTQKAIDGLFVMIAKQEAKIRKNPLEQTSDILKKVFGK